MADKATIGVPNIFPSFRYEDAPKAIEWLNKAFGFEQQFVVPGENNTVAHAQLRLGSGMIMMGSGGKPDPRIPGRRNASAPMWWCPTSRHTMPAPRPPVRRSSARSRH